MSLSVNKTVDDDITYDISGSGSMTLETAGTYSDRDIKLNVMNEGGSSYLEDYLSHDGTNLTVDGGIIVEGHSSKIGSYLNYTRTATISVSTTWKSVASLTLPAGVWIVVGLVSSSSTLSSASNIRCNINDEAAYNYAQIAQYVPSGQYARMKNVSILTSASGRTINLNVYASSSVTIGTNTMLAAVRIA